VRRLKSRTFGLLGEHFPGAGGSRPSTSAGSPDAPEVGLAKMLAVTARCGRSASPGPPAADAAHTRGCVRGPQQRPAVLDAAFAGTLASTAPLGEAGACGGLKAAAVVRRRAPTGKMRRSTSRGPNNALQLEEDAATGACEPFIGAVGATDQDLAAEWPYRLDSGDRDQHKTARTLVSLG